MSSEVEPGQQVRYQGTVMRVIRITKRRKRRVVQIQLQHPSHTEYRPIVSVAEVSRLP